MCVWLASPSPFPGLVPGGACAGAMGVAGFGFGFGRAGAGSCGGVAVVSRLGAGLGEAGAGVVVVGGGGAGAGVGAGAGAGAGGGAELGWGATTCGAAPPREGATGVRTVTSCADGERRGVETGSRGAARSLGAGSSVAGTTVWATTGGAATRTAWSPRWPTRVPGRPIAAVMAPSPAATATSRDQPPLMLEPPSAEQPRSDLIGSGGRNLKDNE